MHWHTCSACTVIQMVTFASLRNGFLTVELLTLFLRVLSLCNLKCSIRSLPATKLHLSEQIT